MHEHCAFLAVSMILFCSGLAAAVDVGMAQLYLGNGSYGLNGNPGECIPQVSYGDGGPPGGNVSCFNPFDIVLSAARGTIFISESGGHRIRSVTNGIVGTLHARSTGEIYGLLMKGTYLYFLSECGNFGPSMWRADTVIGTTSLFAGDPSQPSNNQSTVYNCPALDATFVHLRCIDSALSVLYFTDV